MHTVGYTHNEPAAASTCVCQVYIHTIVMVVLLVNKNTSLILDNNNNGNEDYQAVTQLIM